MVIFLLWLGLVCCGVANGLIYDYVSTPGRYYYMMVPSIIAIILLIFHRIYTREWSEPPKKTRKNKKKIQAQRYFPVFGFSAMFSSAMFLSAVLGVQTNEVSWGVFVGSATAVVSFFTATARESYYV